MKSKCALRVFCIKKLMSKVFLLEGGLYHIGIGLGLK